MSVFVTVSCDCRAAKEQLEIKVEMMRRDSQLLLQEQEDERRVLSRQIQDLQRERQAGEADSARKLRQSKVSLKKASAKLTAVCEAALQVRE